jgi:nucleotide-binding universal stress UspA family protein
MFSKILVALDGSEAAWNALDCAIDLARNDQATLTIISVFEPLQSTSKFEPTPENISPYLQVIRKEHADLLDVSIKKVNEKAPSVTVNKMLVHGKAREKIVEASMAGNFDLIVMGSRGTGGIRGCIGSVSRSVVDEAPCPVLIVK